MKRLKAYLLIGLAYILALVAGFIVWKISITTVDEILALFLADISATIVIWIFGLLFHNSSFYDPYWSFIPWIIVLFLICKDGLWSTTNIIFFIVFSMWSYRLTINWAYTCLDITTQDWRYTKFKQDNKAFLWHLINLFGINIIPTIIVFMGTIPAIKLIQMNNTFNPLSLIGISIILFGTIIEFFADWQMHKFRRSSASKEVMDKGLWRYSRHPNYFGEISIWLGVYICMVVFLPSQWYLGFGFLAMVFLFVFISIPLMEKRQIARRSNYAEYRQKTSMILLLMPKIKK